ncbi:hypothetical protein HWV00_11415 [Moritella sp. 24]|uniref:hypothetical protein n=1 Tax=Moritella sp. 24 TaxID=2746230 RepID=UPI001BADE699|nr:hypothetical protein [Moritella sp. 24]QUM76794.1 hypothetical protein HWV00_11415 [Moritella sp. 24]
MKKSILLLGLLFSGATFANNTCRDIIPGGPIEELESPSISVLGSGGIYANGNMQAQIRVDYKAQGGFSLMNITLCDAYEMEPIEAKGKWKVDEIENDYLHEILSRQSSNDDSLEDVNTNMGDWIPFYDTRYLRTTGNEPVSADVCVVVTGMQSDGELIAKTSCIGDDMSSIHIAAGLPEPAEFELKSKKIRDEKNNRAKVYELHSVNQVIQVKDIQYSNGVKEATASILRLNGSSSYNVLRDYQKGNWESSWVGVWAYDSSKVYEIEHINAISHSVGSFSLSTITPPSTSSLITSFFLFQIHEQNFMIADNFCAECIYGMNDCINYDGDTSHMQLVSDRLTNDLTITDFYGTARSLTVKFGNGNDNDDLFIY